MGLVASKSPPVSRHIIWCDTEGGVRNVKLWDITCIDETAHGVSGYRFCSARDATKRGRSNLCKSLPPAVYQDSVKTGSTCAIRYHRTSCGKWEAEEYTNINIPLPRLLDSYLVSKKGSIVIAWNMRGHDKHVLRRAVGARTLENLTLWDALPWFRSRYQLPKNTMSSSKPGTPRSVFDVPDHGDAHSSLADAAHMRDTVLRAAYCHRLDGLTDLTAYKRATREEQFDSVCAEVDESTAVEEWCSIADSAWSVGTIPGSIYKVVHSI